MENAAPKIVALIQEEMQSRAGDAETDTEDEYFNEGQDVESDMEVDET